MNKILPQAPPLIASQSTVDMYGIEGEREDTSNEAYFYRHYRAEAREKLFYEELFESRIKQQQILEEKEKRRKKKKKRGRKSNKNTENGDNKTTKRGRGRKKSKCDNSDEDEGENDEQNDMDLTLPKIPKGPWTYKLGAEYDKKPVVPSIVSHKPQFNYHIPYKELKNKQFILDENKRKELDNWWKMPPNLIRRTDYGNMGNVIVPVNNQKNSNNNTSNSCSSSTNTTTNSLSKNSLSTNSLMTNKAPTRTNNNKINKEEERKKQELIQMYKLLKQAEKTKTKQNKKSDTKKNKKKYKNVKVKDKEKNIPCSSGPVDIRSLLNRK